MNKVYLGCGTDIRPGWTNIDILPINHKDYIQHDLRYGLPESIKDVDIFFMSHTTEHLTPEANISILTKMRQALSETGKIYLEIPDFRSAIVAYLNKDWDYFNHPSIMAFCPDGRLGQLLDYALHQRTDGVPEHITFVDRDLMCLWLSKAGFKRIHESEYVEGISNPNPLRRQYSLYFEAS